MRSSHLVMPAAVLLLGLAPIVMAQSNQCIPEIVVGDPPQDLNAHGPNVNSYDPAVDLLSVGLLANGPLLDLRLGLVGKPSNDPARVYAYFVGFQVVENATTNTTRFMSVSIQGTTTYDRAFVYEPGGENLGYFPSEWDGTNVTIRIPWDDLRAFFGRPNLTIGTPEASATGPHPTQYGRLVPTMYLADDANRQDQPFIPIPSCGSGAAQEEVPIVGDTLEESPGPGWSAVVGASVIAILLSRRR